MEDVLGGIVADDMGLGKTLSMLSAIIKSSSRAIDFAVEQTRAPAKAWSDVVPSKATLVVVPSACASFHTFRPHRCPVTYEVSVTRKLDRRDPEV